MLEHWIVITGKVAVDYHAWFGFVQCETCAYPVDDR